MLKYWLWLTNLRGLSNQTRLALLRHFGTPEDIYYADEGEILLTEGITRQQAALLADHDLTAANRILADCQRLNINLLTLQDAAYPSRLKNIYDPPCLLYYKGRMPAFDEEAAIAVVGTRDCTPYGVACAEKLSYGMASGGALIVTGLAAGVDSAAARGALRAGGTVAGVVGNGLDVPYPYENRYLYEDVAAAGVLISEYPPGTRPAASHFPVRNRILSGLALATLVVEAPERSGALISASRALDQGRDVFAVPGPIDDPRCAGSNKLLRDGAGVVTDAWDILSHYAARYPHRIRQLRVEEPRSYGEPAPREAPAPAPATPGAEDHRPLLDLEGDHGLTDDQIRIVKELQEGTLHVDDIIDRTQIPTRRVLSALTMLEIDEIVAQSSGKRFSLAVTLK